mmetsp:Transcript_23170/g.57428  ORF Transcript_23170/g.57428 Transcript_23170/m.57428 type:complete len:271 (+) Transcript_23170:541-1353(+)
MVWWCAALCDSRRMSWRSPPPRSGTPRVSRRKLGGAPPPPFALPPLRPSPSLSPLPPPPPSPRRSSPPLRVRRRLRVAPRLLSAQASAAGRARARPTASSFQRSPSPTRSASPWRPPVGPGRWPGCEHETVRRGWTASRRSARCSSTDGDTPIVPPSCTPRWWASPLKTCSSPPRTSPMPPPSPPLPPPRLRARVSATGTSRLEASIWTKLPGAPATSQIRSRRWSACSNRVCRRTATAAAGRRRRVGPAFGTPPCIRGSSASVAPSLPT